MGGRESFLFSVLLLVACAQKAPSAPGDAAVSPNRDAPAEMAGVMAPPGDDLWRHRQPGDRVMAV